MEAVAELTCLGATEYSAELRMPCHVCDEMSADVARWSAPQILASTSAPQILAPTRFNSYGPGLCFDRAFHFHFSLRRAPAPTRRGRRPAHPAAAPGGACPASPPGRPRPQVLVVVVPRRLPSPKPGSGSPWRPRGHARRPAAPLSGRLQRCGPSCTHSSREPTPGRGSVTALC